jgi:raffinose/stachyose/melibiose transport system substrate-binding protein
VLWTNIDARAVGVGSVHGWLVSRDAPKQTVDFMKLWLGKDIQTKFAPEGLSIPMVKGTVDAIQNPFYL